MFDFVGVGILVILLLLFAWLTWRAWRARNKVVRWAGGLVSGLLTLLIALVTGVVLYGFAQLNQTHSNPAADIKVASTPDQLARGTKLVNACVGCHSSNGQAPLAGQDFFADGGPPIGTLYAANLTPGGELKDWTDGEIIRAIREGIHKNGRSLVIMPAGTFHNMSDTDVQAIVAYLRSQPAAPATPPTNLNLIGALLIAISGDDILSAQPPLARPVVAPPAGPTAAYGQYLVAAIGSCRDCHGPNLTGGVLDQDSPPAGPDLTTVGQRWSEADFMQAIRTGTKPDGALFSEEMPWKDISAFASDDDLRAIYAYLKTLTP